MNQLPMTLLGAQKLREELHHLKTVERHQIIQAISEARAHGDLKENAEYHEAKRQQGFIEGRIQELEGKLSHCQVIDVTTFPNHGRVIFGATVSLTNADTGEEVRYQIVGEDEADIKEHKISINSPIARAMIGKNVDDVIEVQTPKGRVSYEITEVEYV